MQFENRFYTTREMYQEYVQKVLCRKIYTLGTGFLVLGLITLVLSIQSHKMLAAVEGTCVVIILAVMLAAPRLMLKQLLEMDERLHKGSHPECVVTFGPQIIMTEGQQSLTIDYDQVVKIYRMKTCSVLMLSKQQGIFFMEDYFTVGNARYFEEFILEECKQVQQIENR